MPEKQEPMTYGQLLEAIESLGINEETMNILGEGIVGTDDSANERFWQRGRLLVELYQGTIGKNGEKPDQKTLNAMAKSIVTISPELND